MKTLIAYFSATGITKEKAKEIAKKTGGDLHEIKPAVAYTKEDLDWMNPNSRSSVEMKDKNFRPDIENDTLDASKYEEIYLGFPIWWYVAPTIVNSFLEKHDFAGKNVKLFATSGSSGFGNTIQELQSSAPETTFEEWMINGKTVS